MPLDKRELSYLWDIQKAAKEINDFLSGVRYADFEKSKVLRYAAERLLLIIGEAANNLSPQFRNKHPEIPWAIFIRFRNILAHEYGESLLTRVWLAGTESVPELLNSLENYLPMKKKTSKSQPGDMLPEYDLKGKKGVRGKYTKGLQKGYSVRVLNEDGTVTVRDFVPNMLRAPSSVLVYLHTHHRGWQRKHR
jgi:uncharacterized protein with HEPN domain